MAALGIDESASMDDSTRRTFAKIKKYIDGQIRKVGTRTAYRTVYQALVKGGTGNQAMTAGFVVVGACTITVPVVDGDVYTVTGVFDMLVTTGGATGIGALYVNGAGVAVPQYALFSAAINGRATVTQQWTATIIGSGNVVFDLRVTGVGVSSVLDHTSLRIEVRAATT